MLSRRAAWFLLGFGVWSWVIWPTFLKNIWADHRSWNHGMTAFFGVHLVLTVVSLALGTIIGALGVRALRARRQPSGGIEPAPGLSPVRRRRWVNGPALDRVWKGPAPRDLEHDIARIDASVIDPYDA